MRRACESLTAGCGLTNSSLRLSPMRGASGLASSPVSRGQRKRGRRKNFLVLLGLVVDVPAQSVGHSCCGAETGTHSAKLCRRRDIRQVQFLVDVDAPVVAQRQGYGQTVQKTVLVPQLQSIEVRRPPFVPQRQIPMVLPVQKTIETPQLQSVRWSMPLLCRSCHARCRTDRCSWFRHCRKLWRCHRCSSLRLWTSL